MAATRQTTARARAAPSRATPTRVLVAYATRNGSTAEVARRIAATLRDRGRRVELRAAEDVGGVGAYDAVVFGSPVYHGRWLPEAEAFVRRNGAALAARPVWLFSVASFGDRSRTAGRLVALEPWSIGAWRKAIGVRDHRVFAGVVERDRWPFFTWPLFWALGGRFGDRRDWLEIDAWAHGIRRALRALRPRAQAASAAGAPSRENATPSSSSRPRRSIRTSRG